MSALRASSEPVRDVYGRSAGRLPFLWPDTFERVFEEHRPMALKIAFWVTRDTEASQDVLQDAFLAAWGSASYYDPRRGTIGAWLLTIVRHRAIDHVRRRWRGQSVSFEEVTSEVFTPERLIAADRVPAIEARLEVTRLMAVLDRLNPAQREAVELSFLAGLTHPQIAAVLGLPLGTVKARIRFGLLRLRMLAGEPAPFLHPGSR